MALFNKKIDFDNIQSVILLETTQTYASKSKWGISFNNSLNASPIVMEDSIPDGSIYTFSVTYNDGKQEIVKVKSGSEQADLLLQKAMDNTLISKVNEVSTSTKPRDKFVLNKNQLPNGTYIIGKDIPIGTYDFNLVFGNGIFSIYKTNSDTTLGNLKESFYIGKTFAYEHSQIINIKCDEGNRIDINGNCVLEISKSKKVEIDL